MLDRLLGVRWAFQRVLTRRCTRAHLFGGPFPAVPSPLRLIVVSIGVFYGSGSCAGFDFFLEEALVVGEAGVAGDDSEAEAEAEAGSDVSSGISVIDSGVASSVAGAGAASGFFKGEVAAGLVSPVLFFLVGGSFLPGHFGPALVSLRLIIGFGLDLARIFSFRPLG